jgi:hypothetical protein
MSVTENPTLGDISEIDRTTEQGENRGETRDTVFQAIDRLEDHAKGWGDQQQRRFWVLQALIDLSREQPGDATTGFSAYDLWEKVNKANKWMPLQRDPQAIAKSVRNEIGRLREANLEHEASMSKVCLSYGHDWWPVIEAVVGGGSANPTRYRIETRPITAMTRAAITKRTEPVQGEVQYEIDVSVRLGFYLRWIQKGLLLKGATRALYLGVGAVLVISVVGLAGVVGLSLLFGREPGPAVFVFVAYTWLIYTELLPPYRVITNRIQKAPTIIQGFDDRLLLEWRGKPRYPASELHVVRYLGVCPLCSGKVNVDKRHWWGVAEDLVGRCENAPRQHVFTFDHELKIGTRIPPNL